MYKYLLAVPCNFVLWYCGGEIRIEYSLEKGGRRGPLRQSSEPAPQLMDSLPEQHIDSLPKYKREGTYRQIGMVCAFRAKGLSEDEVAEKAQFNTVEDMYFRLKCWGLSGLVPREEDVDKTERRARTTSEPVELPSAYDALPLFHRALQKLDWAIGDLENRKEYLQNGRFVGHESTGPAYSPETGIEEGTLTIPMGGQQTPLEPLPVLIGAYVLADEPLEPLLEKLNRWPQSVDKEQIQALIGGKKAAKGHTRGLKSIVGMIARGIRGGTIRPGPTTGEFSERIQNGVWYSRQLTQRGFDPATISERLSEANFTRQEISQIQSLRQLPQPG